MGKNNKSRGLYFSERITKAMNAIVDYPMTVVEAPLGYGKTTAVREHLNVMHATILRQKIYDNSIKSFWNGFCLMLGKIDPGRAHSLERLGFPGDRMSMLEAYKLIEGIEMPEKTVLFIDDYHWLNDTEAGKFFEFLVLNEIENLHIVLTARYFELPHMEELVLKGYLLHISKETFELLPHEIIKYYELCGIGIKDAQAWELHAITEGWISALYLLMLNYKAEGRFMTSENIYKLLENAVYKPFSAEIRDFLLDMSIFNSFTKNQAAYIWGSDDAEALLDEITGKNAFVDYDAGTRAYHIHKIFTNFLHDELEKRDEIYKGKLYKKAGDWCMQNGDYFEAMHYFYMAGDFDNLLLAAEIDRGNDFAFESKERIIRYFEECPHEYKRRHPLAMLVYAMALVTFHELDRFRNALKEIAMLIESSGLDQDSKSGLMGELELLKGFTHYNDIRGMSRHHQKACQLMKRPSAFMATRGSWTFGAPSVLYMFYRESGKLEQEVRDIKETMPYYYQLTEGHGMGAEYVMAAERHFNMGDFENAEILAHKALQKAGGGHQSAIVVCALFLQIRLNLMKGDYEQIMALFGKMNEEIEHKKKYMMIYTIDMCKGFVNASLRQHEQMPEWLTEGGYYSRRLFFPNWAFFNIIYGRALLLNKEYFKLLGSAEHFAEIASFFPNTLAKIYNEIHIAAALERICRRGEALEAVRKALDMAVPDQIYMPFVENGDYIQPLLEELYSQKIHAADIEKIFELYKPYCSALEGIRKEYFAKSRLRLTEREKEIAMLAVEGYSNKAIGERLYISENTVKTQLKSVFEKTGVNSRFLLKRFFEVNQKIAGEERMGQ